MITLSGKLFSMTSAELSRFYLNSAVESDYKLSPKNVSDLRTDPRTVGSGAEFISSASFSRSAIPNF